MTHTMVKFFQLVDKRKNTSTARGVDNLIGGSRSSMDVVVCVCVSEGCERCTVTLHSPSVLCVFGLPGRSRCESVGGCVEMCGAHYGCN